VGEPGDCLLELAVEEVWEHGVDGQRAIADHA
jgi:hypothetical protein